MAPWITAVLTVAAFVTSIVSAILGMAGGVMLLAVMLCFTAAAHFNSMRADLVRMVPPMVPYPELMVSLTGVCEIMGAIGLLVLRTRRVAAFALILFLIAVLPANIHAAQSGVTLRGAPATPLIPRVALQVFFIALVWWSGVRAARGHTVRRSD